MKSGTFSFKNFIKNRFSDICSLYHEALLDNSDNNAKNRQGHMYAGYFTQIIASLVSGVYFTSLMIQMEAGDVFIGYVNTLTSCCVLVQLIAPLILERITKRKNFLILLRSIYNFLNIVVISIVPFINTPKPVRLAIFMTIVVLMHSINQFSTPGFSILQLQTLPNEQRASFFTIHSLTHNILSVSTSFLAGIIVDNFELNQISFGGISPALSAFFVLRLLALIAVIFEIKYLLQITEYPYIKDSTNSKIDFSVMFLPLKNRQYMMTIIIVFLYNFFSNLPGQYFNVYLIDVVHMSYTSISLVTMLALPVMLIMAPFWAKTIKKHSWFKILIIGILCVSFAVFLNIFVTSDTKYMYFVVMFVFYFFSPIITLNVNNIPYMKMPSTNQTVYVSFYSLFVTLGTILGNFIGTQIFTFTGGLTIHMFGLDLLNYQYIRLFQAILYIPLAIYVFFVRRSLLKDPENKKINV